MKNSAIKRKLFIEKLPMVDLHNDRAFCITAANTLWTNCFRCDMCERHYNRSQFFFALWRPPYDYTSWHHYLLTDEQKANLGVMSHYDFLLKAIEKLKETEIPITRNPQNIGSSKNHIFLGIEGANLLNKEHNELNEISKMPEYIPDLLAELREKKVSYITLTWNTSNPYIGNHMEPNKGLTKTGEKLVRHIIDAGIQIDLSHASPKGVSDFFLFTGGGVPLFFSHSNVASLCRHSRNLSDSILYMLEKSKGLMGINYSANFLNIVGNATGRDIFKHIDYVIRNVGEDNVALGSDFDGWVKLPRGIRNPTDIRDLFINESNYSERILRKIFYENAHDFFLRNIKN